MLRLCVLAAALLLAAAGWAQYPARPIRLVSPFPPEEAAAYIESEQKKWGRVIRERGIKAE
jgi:tripartite-type tricarboxylate transporter receptor subunit TctC